MDDNRIKDGMSPDLPLREAIDACRPGSNDIAEPELDRVARRIESDEVARSDYQKVQRFDARLQPAFHDVAIPAGLAERLLARLQAAENNQPTAGLTDEPSETSAERPLAVVDRAEQAEHESTGRSTRRRWLWSAAALAASIVVAVAGFWSLRSPGLTAADLGNQGTAWYGQLSPDWKALDSAPRAYPIPSSLTVSPRAWQGTTRTVGVAGVAYDLSRRGLGKAVLFVVRHPVSGLPSNPPVTPQSATGGWTVAAWRSGSLTYVLVVQGDANRYRSLINTSLPPLA